MAAEMCPMGWIVEPGPDPQTIVLVRWLLLPALDTLSDVTDWCEAH